MPLCSPETFIINFSLTGETVPNKTNFCLSPSEIPLPLIIDNAIGFPDTYPLNQDLSVDDLFNV